MPMPVTRNRRPRSCLRVLVLLAACFSGVEAATALQIEPLSPAPTQRSEGATSAGCSRSADGIKRPAVKNADGSTAVPERTRWIEDRTGTLSAECIDRIEQRIDALQRARGSQLAVLVVPDIGDESIEAYAERVFRQWQPGRRGVDDGVLLVVAPDNRSTRIEIGYGLEGVIPDLLAAQIVRDQLLPAFRERRYGEGLDAAVARLDELIRADQSVPTLKLGQLWAQQQAASWQEWRDARGTLGIVGLWITGILGVAMAWSLLLVLLLRISPAAATRASRAATAASATTLKSPSAPAPKSKTEGGIFRKRKATERIKPTLWQWLRRILLGLASMLFWVAFGNAMGIDGLPLLCFAPFLALVGFGLAAMLLDTHGDDRIGLREIGSDKVMFWIGAALLAFLCAWAYGFAGAGAWGVGLFSAGFLGLFMWQARSGSVRIGSGGYASSGGSGTGSDRSSSSGGSSSRSGSSSGSSGSSGGRSGGGGASGRW